MARGVPHFHSRDIYPILLNREYHGNVWFLKRYAHPAYLREYFSKGNQYVRLTNRTKFQDKSPK